MSVTELKPIPVVARSKACVYGRSLVGIAASNPAVWKHGCLSFVSVLCCPADKSSRGDLESVECLDVIMKPRQ